MTQTVTGTVTQYETNLGTFQSREHGTFNKNRITVQTDDGTEVQIQKNTKPDTKFTLKAGSKVRIKYDTSEHGNTVSRDRDAVVLLDQQKGSNLTNNSTGTNNNSTYDPKGARTGMLLKAGLDLALARHGKSVTQSQISLAVAEMGAVAEAFEKGGQGTLGGQNDRATTGSQLSQNGSSKGGSMSQSTGTPKGSSMEMEDSWEDETPN